MQAARIKLHYMSFNSTVLNTKLTGILQASEYAYVPMRVQSRARCLKPSPPAFCKQVGMHAFLCAQVCKCMCVYIFICVCLSASACACIHTCIPV